VVDIEASLRRLGMTGMVTEAVASNFAN
jgi:hypothetical protein